MNSSNKKVVDLENVNLILNDEDILKNITLNIKDGEFVSLVGASGSGKSTILKIIAGILSPNSSTKFDIPEHVGYAPQNNLLLDYYNVKDNILLFEKIKGKKINNDDFLKIIKIFGLEDHQKKYPSELSGGLKSRVTLLRAYYTGNDLLLLDEPFSALDELKKIELRKWLKNIHKTLMSSILYVTHDINEALDLSDRIIVIKDGKIKREFEKSDMSENTYDEILKIILDK